MSKRTAYQFKSRKTQTSQGINRTNHLNQEESRATQYFLDLVIEQFPNMVFVKNATDLSYVRFNRAGEELTGFKRDVLIGKSDLDFFPKEQADFFNLKDRETLNGKESIVIEEEFIQTHHKGQRLLRTKKVPILNADGTARYLLGISEDITDQRRAEEERDRFFTISLDLLTVCTFDGFVKRVNPAVKEVLGYTPEEFCAVPYMERVHPDDIQATVDEVGRLSQGQTVFTFEQRYQHKDGSYRWISWKSSAYDGLMYACGRDVTAERAARTEIESINRDLEKRVAERTHELEVAANRSKRIVSSNLIGIMFWNNDGVITDANAAFLEMVGYSQQDLLEGRLNIPLLCVPEDSERDQIALVELRDLGRCRPYEKSYIHKKGHKVSVSLGAVRFDDEPDQGICYVIDLTEAKRVEGERNEAFLRERAANDSSKMKSEFLANMSHEIRTPINGIIGMIGLLSNTPLQGEQLEFADGVRRSADALLTVINDILDFSKIEAGKLEFEDIDFDMSRLFSEIEKSFVFQSKAKGLALKFEFDPELPRYVGGDPGRLRQVMNNLMSNALKFTSKGSIHVRVQLENRNSRDAQFRIEVIDTGMGISKDGLKKMFQAFSQADTSTTRKFGGTGLGLSISKYLVEKMNGTIGVESEETKGSKFWFTSRLRLGGKILAEELSLDNAVAGSFAYPFQILLAEDNLINQKIAIKVLEGMGLKVHAVGNGREILAALQKHKYDLILMDCQMPELDGYETTRMIRASRKLPRDITIIAMTANAMKGEREHCLEAGMNDYVSKPVKREVLFSMLNHWLVVRAQAKSA